jgi:transposase
LAPRRIADLLERSWSGVRKTINRFNREGLASLSDKPLTGRPRKTNDPYAHNSRIYLTFLVTFP